MAISFQINEVTIRVKIPINSNILLIYSKQQQSYKGCLVSEFRVESLKLTSFFPKWPIKSEFSWLLVIPNFINYWYGRTRIIFYPLLWSWFNLFYRYFLGQLQFRFRLIHLFFSSRTFIEIFCVGKMKLLQHTYSFFYG